MNLATTKQVFNAFIELAKSYLLKSASGLSGFKLWIAKIVIGQIIIGLKKLGVIIENSAEAKEKLKKYEDILKKPNITPEERRNADRDFLT